MVVLGLTRIVLIIRMSVVHSSAKPQQPSNGRCKHKPQNPSPRLAGDLKQEAQPRHSGLDEMSPCCVFTRLRIGLGELGRHMSYVRITSN